MPDSRKPEKKIDLQPVVFDPVVLLSVEGKSKKLVMSGKKQYFCFIRVEKNGFRAILTGSLTQGTIQPEETPSWQQKL